MEKKLGKIERVSFGHGGYQDSCLGINITLSGADWGVCDNKTAWDANLIKHTKHCQWTDYRGNTQRQDQDLGDSRRGREMGTVNRHRYRTFKSCALAA